MEGDNGTTYWLVGAAYGGSDDQTERFLEEGIWENGYKNKYIDKVMSIKVGDRIGIKSAYTQKYGLPFDNRGLFVSVMKIKAIGTVTENLDDGRTLKVDWQKNENPLEWYLYTGRSTIWRLSQDRWNGKALIDFVFNGKPQDITRFRNDPYWRERFGDRVQKRIARLTWNTNDWLMPSGTIGKSKDQDTHEGKFGFGHEEWLFNTEKLIDGYHYGFLEPVNKHFDTYSGKAYDTWLYTIEDVGKKRNRYVVGYIKELEVLTKKQARDAYKEYKHNGWLNEMKLQLKDVDADVDEFTKWKDEKILNVRFLPENLSIEEDFIHAQQIADSEGLSRYTFAEYKDSYLCEETIEKVQKDNFSFKSQKRTDSDVTSSKTKKGKYRREAKNVEVIYQHNEISKKLTEQLREIYGWENVTPEHAAGYGRNSIDIAVRRDKGLIFYEIKTYNSLMSCIREAIGQLIEYSMWPDQQKAEELIIVSPFYGKIGKVSTYMKHIRKIYNIPLYYQAFDLVNNTLSEKY
jgi:hypothetical protein